MISKGKHDDVKLSCLVLKDILYKPKAATNRCFERWSKQKNASYLLLFNKKRFFTLFLLFFFFFFFFT